MNILHTALLGNAIFSLSTSLFLLIFSKKVAQWFGQENPTIFLVIGLGLIYFSYSIFKQLKHPKPDAVFYIIVQDMLWVFASILLLTFKPFSLTLPGNQIVASVAIMVLIFSIVQSIGLAQTDSTNVKGMKRLTFKRIVKATKENTWKTISDVSGYHKVAPNIDSVEIISGHDKGMIRSCTYKTDNWTEIATLWDVGDQYSFRVNTEAENYPYPIKHLQGTWKAVEISENQTQIIMQFELIYNHKIYNLLLHPFMRKKFNKICIEILDNYQKLLETA